LTFITSGDHFSLRWDTFLRELFPLLNGELIPTLFQDIRNLAWPPGFRENFLLPPPPNFGTKSAPLSESLQPRPPMFHKTRILPYLRLFFLAQRGPSSFPATENNLL